MKKEEGRGRRRRFFVSYGLTNLIARKKEEGRRGSRRFFVSLWP